MGGSCCDGCETGPKPEKTMESGAWQAVHNCVRVQPGERVVIITDKETDAVGQALFSQVFATTTSVSGYRLEDFGDRPEDGKNPLQFPDAIRYDLERADVSFFAAQSRPGEYGSFRHPMIEVVEAKGLRHAHMFGINKRIMCEGMCADYAAIQRLSAQVAEVVRSARQIRVTSPAGTDLTVQFNPAYKWLVCDGNIQPGHWSNLPDGEVFTSPETANGTVVVDGILGDNFSRKYGLLDSTPVTLKFNHGTVYEVSCANRELLSELTKYLKTEPNADRMGEFAIGTNIGLTELVGELLQDEKFPGVHYATGHPFPDKTGATWDSPNTHLDGVLRNVTVEVDGRRIMEGSRFLL